MDETFAKEKFAISGFSAKSWKSVPHEIIIV